MQYARSFASASLLCVPLASPASAQQVIHASAEQVTFNVGTNIGTDLCTVTAAWQVGLAQCPHGGASEPIQVPQLD